MIGSVSVLYFGWVKREKQVLVCDGILINIRVLRLFFEECKKTKNLDIGAILRGAMIKEGI